MVRLPWRLLAATATAAPAAAATAPATGQISAPAQEGESVVTAAVQVTPAAEPAPEKAARRRYRELNDADREKMERLEHSSPTRTATRAAELERELRKIKGSKETQQRIFTATKSELDLVKDKYKALEKRLNRTLLERDLLRRAIKDLEKKTGMLADRTELTPDEVAASDQSSDETARERANAEAQRADAAGPGRGRGHEGRRGLRRPERGPASSEPATA